MLVVKFQNIIYIIFKHIPSNKNFLNLKFKQVYYLILNFYQINKDGEIRTRDHLVIKVMIPYQKIISTQ